MTPFFDDFEQQLRAAAVAQSAPRRWWRRPRNVALLAVAGLGLATPALGRVSGVWDPGIDEPPAQTAVTVAASHSTTCKEPPTGDRPPANARLDPRLVAELAVLRRPQRDADTLPADLRRRGGGAPNLVARTARYVGSVAGRRYFVAAASSRVHVAGCGKQPATTRLDLCLLSERGGGGCGIGADDFRKQGIEGSSGASGNRSVVTGLVPDGVTAVTLRYEHSERSFAVKDNFYAFEVAVDVMRRPDAVTWTLRNGQRRKIR